jgi:hypothetical protein
MPGNRINGEDSPNSAESIFACFNWSHQLNDNWAAKQQFSIHQQNINLPVIFPNKVANGQVVRWL